VTIFSVQHFLEDHFDRRGLSDVDQYAIRIANIFEQCGSGVSVARLGQEFRRVRTVFFRRNSVPDREGFETQLAGTLVKKFPKKKPNIPEFKRFEHALKSIRVEIRSRRRSMRYLITEFRSVVESRAVDAFWKSRRRHHLRAKPEKIAQGLLAVFAKGVLGGNGVVLREIASGIGFVDVGVLFGKVLHLIELKILKGKFTGAGQLATYMRTEGRREGWLLLVDVRAKRQGQDIPATINVPPGKIRTVVVSVNPPPPHLV